MKEPAFYFDFRDPWSYLVAESILGGLPVAAPWMPIDSLQLAEGCAWSRAATDGTDLDSLKSEFEQAAKIADLQQVRWPKRFPFDSTDALVAAWHAKSIGRSVGYSLPAFRQAFAGGHDLQLEQTILIAASAAEIHPRSVTQALSRQTIKDQLQDATDQAIELGVRSVPAIWTGERVIHGPNCLSEAYDELSTSKSNPKSS